MRVELLVHKNEAGPTLSLATSQIKQPEGRESLLFEAIQKYNQSQTLKLQQNCSEKGSSEHNDNYLGLNKTRISQQNTRCLKLSLINI